MLGRVIRDISRFALVKVDQGSNSLQIHRLVQAVIRSQMSDEDQVSARDAVHEIWSAPVLRRATDYPGAEPVPRLHHLAASGSSQADECDDAWLPAADRLGALPVEAR